MRMLQSRGSAPWPPGKGELGPAPSHEQQLGQFGLPAGLINSGCSQLSTSSPQGWHRHKGFSGKNGGCEGRIQVPPLSAGSHPLLQRGPHWGQFTDGREETPQRQG